MLTALKNFLRLILPSAVYGGMIYTTLAAIFKKAEWGLFLMVIMIPQPNVWYKLREYPMGKDFMDLLFFAIFVGILYQHKGFEKTSNTIIIFLFLIISYLSLWNSSTQFSLPLPLTRSNELLEDWKNYAEMILLYFLVLGVVKNEDQQRTLIVLMSIVVLFIAIRSYRNFTGGAVFNYDKREGGPFEAVGLGANHFGAFIAYTCALFLGLAVIDQHKRRKIFYWAAVLFGLHPLFFSYSRGAYLAAFGILAFYGVLKKKSLLVVCLIILIAWQTVLPASVVDRIMMTETNSGELEGSAASRLRLWQQANSIFENNPVFGVGFGGFGLSVRDSQLLTDTHSFYMKTLCEQGIIGIIFLFMIFLKAFHSGWRLHKSGKSSFSRGLGLGFMGSVVALMITNLFGDRWSYFALGSYFWIFWAIVDRGILLSRTIGTSEVNKAVA